MYDKQIKILITFIIYDKIKILVNNNEEMGLQENLSGLPASDEQIETIDLKRPLKNATTIH